MSCGFARVVTRTAKQTFIPFFPWTNSPGMYRKLSVCHRSAGEHSSSCYPRGESGVTEAEQVARPLRPRRRRMRSDAHRRQTRTCVCVAGTNPSSIKDRGGLLAVSAGAKCPRPLLLSPELGLIAFLTPPRISQDFLICPKHSSRPFLKK